MKNVAGYDVSRLVVGSHGTLGIILAASVKVLPRPECERTLHFACDHTAALERVVGWGRSPLPITATCHVDQRLSVRLSGTTAGVRAAERRLGGDAGGDDAVRFWADVRDHRHPYFSSRAAPHPLWRLSLPTAAPFPDLDGEWLTEWGGALRWLKSDAPLHRVRDAARRLGGFAHLFSQRSGFPALDPITTVYHQRLKAAFDPESIFNRGRYPVLSQAS
jgi:glycolate oxidase FAD binding subunit